MKNTISDRDTRIHFLSQLLVEVNSELGSVHQRELSLTERKKFLESEIRALGVGTAVQLDLGI